MNPTALGQNQWHLVSIHSFAYKVGDRDRKRCGADTAHFLALSTQRPRSHGSTEQAEHQTPASATLSLTKRNQCSLKEELTPTRGRENTR